MTSGFDPSMLNLAAKPKGIPLIVGIYDFPSTSSNQILSISQLEEIGRTTGDWAQDNVGNKWYKISIYRVSSGFFYGWVQANRLNLYSKPEITPNVSGDNIIKVLTGNDRRITNNLLLTRELFARLNAKGIDTSAYRSNFNKLTLRLNSRQYKIRTSSLVKFEEKVDDGYSWLFDKFGLSGVSNKSSNLGALPLIPIAVALIVGAGATAAIYFVFKPDYDESKTDLKLSADLKSLLEKVDPVTAQAIQDDLEKQIDDAYNRGKTDQWLGDIGSILKYGLIVGGTLYFVPKAINAITEHNKNAVA